MKLNVENLAALTTSYRAEFQKGLEAAQPQFEKVAMRVPSGSKTNSYAWLGSLSGIREFVGERFIQNLSVSVYSIANKCYEETYAVSRADIEDDQYGTYAPLIQQLGYNARIFPDSIIFGLAKNGATELCYDGQPFLSTSHPVGNSVASNFSDGQETALWYLLDTRHPVKPFVYQEREPFRFDVLDDLSDEHVFKYDEILYGVYGRAAAGFGLWQLAYGLTDELDEESVKSARAAMASLRGPGGNALNIWPNVILVGPTNYDAAEAIVKASQKDGTSNTLFGAFEIVVSPYLE